MGSFLEKISNTTSESERLLRLPLYYKLSNDSIEKIVEAIKEFYKR